MKKRLIGLAAVYLLIPAMLLAQPAGKKRLVGVWAVKVAPVEHSQSPLLSLAMFGGDGSFTTGVGYKALPPMPVVQDFATELGPGYGRWAATGEREFRLMFYAVMRKAGAGAGFQRVQDTLVLSESGDEYTGHAQVDFLDADWNVVFSTTSEEKGTRLETPVSSMPVGEPAGKKPTARNRCSRNKTRCGRVQLTQLRPIGENGRQRVPAGVLLRIVEGRLGERIRSEPEQRGLARVGR